MSGYNIVLVHGHGAAQQEADALRLLLLLPFPPEDCLILFTILLIVTVDPDTTHDLNYAVACVCPPLFNCYFLLCS